MVGVTICNFVFWPARDGQPPVPIPSRWRLQEQRGGQLGSRIFAGFWPTATRDGAADDFVPGLATTWAPETSVQK